MNREEIDLAYCKEKRISIINQRLNSNVLETIDILEWEWIIIDDNFLSRINYFRNL